MDEVELYKEMIKALPQRAFIGRFSLDILTSEPFRARVVATLKAAGLRHDTAYNIFRDSVKRKDTPDRSGAATEKCMGNEKPNEALCRGTADYITRMWYRENERKREIQ